MGDSHSRLKRRGNIYLVRCVNVRNAGAETSTIVITYILSDGNEINEAESINPISLDLL